MRNYVDENRSQMRKNLLINVKLKIQLADLNLYYGWRTHENNILSTIKMGKNRFKMMKEHGMSYFQNTCLYSTTFNNFKYKCQNTCLYATTFNNFKYKCQNTCLYSTTFNNFKYKCQNLKSINFCVKKQEFSCYSLLFKTLFQFICIFHFPLKYLF